MIEKKEYTTPAIEIIILDNEISLALESEPPTYEQILNGKSQEFFNNEPFKNLYV